MGDDADAKMVLTVRSPDNWKRPPGRPRVTLLNTVQRDLRAYNLTLNEAVDLAQNRPLWRLMSTYGAMHYIMVHARKAEEAGSILSVEPNRNCSIFASRNQESH